MIPSNDLAVVIGISTPTCGSGVGFVDDEEVEGGVHIGFAAGDGVEGDADVGGVADEDDEGGVAGSIVRAARRGGCAFQSCPFLERDAGADLDVGCCCCC